MLLRKINAVSSLLCAVFLFAHAILQAVTMLSMGSITVNASVPAWILAGCMALHAFISIDLVLSSHLEGEGEKRKCKSYPKLNRTMILQRASGMLLIVFTLLHIAGAGGYMQPPQAVHAVLPPLFFAVSLLHTAISVEKALITLGIGTAKFIRTVGISAKVLSAAVLIADIVGFYCYAF